LPARGRDGEDQRHPIGTDAEVNLRNARMRHFEFPADVLADIDRDRSCHPDPAVRRRMEALRLKAHGQTQAAIVQLSGLSRPTVQLPLAKYLVGGLAEARSFHWRGSMAVPP
jgi:hypothetical protein